MRLDVLDVQGRLVTTLVNETRAAGRYEVPWRVSGAASHPEAGVYLVRMSAGGKTFLRKALLLP